MYEAFQYSFHVLSGVNVRGWKIKVFCCKFGLLFCFAYSCDSGQ